MATSNHSDDGVPAKRQKTSNADMDPRANPYLAHRYAEEKPDYSESVFHGLKRHATTAQDAMAVEDGPNNPFNGQQLSKRYFDILKTRRNLPVHSQRYVRCQMVNAS
jgi:pre-mRNA-splicing factor ATP-dependent RNA helicase DHX15/PRP43